MFMSTRCLVNMKLQNNEYLGGALIIGILRIAKNSLLSDMNNVKVRLFIYTTCDVVIYLSRCLPWVRHKGTPQPARSRETRLGHCTTAKVNYRYDVQRAAWQYVCLCAFICRRKSPSYSTTLKGGIMVTQRGMAPSCLTHGRFLTRLQRENWATGGLSLVVKFSLPRLDTDLLAGYDKAIQGRIIALLDSDEDFRTKYQDLLD